jgi:hypothetical protein
LTLATFANPTTTRQQDLAYLDEWSTQHFDQISRGVLTVSENLDVSELIFIYISLVQIRTIAAMTHSNFEQPWLFVLEQLKKGVAADNFGENILTFLGRTEEVARQNLRT